MVSAGLRRRDRAAALVPPLLVALVAILVISPGLMPGVGYWDTAEFQTVAPILGTAHPTGYPTYVILGFIANLLLTPLGEPAFRMNVFSLLCVALAAAVAMRLVARLTGSVVVGMAVGVGLATTPIAWNVAARADPHTLHLALVTLLFAVLVRWEHGRRDASPTADRWLVLAAGLFGLAAANHSLTLLLAAPVGLYVLSVHPGLVRRPRLIGACLAALAVALVVPYLELPLRAGPFRAPLVYGRPDTWDGFWYIALAEQFRGSLVDPLGDLPRKLGDVGALAATQFGFLAPLIPVGFLAAVVRHPRFALLTGSAMLITVFFNASYSNADIGRYYLGPAAWAWAWLGILAGVIMEQVAGTEVFEERDGARDGARDGGAGLDGANVHDPPPVTGGLVAWRSRSVLTVTAAVLAAVLVLPAAAAFEPRSTEADRSGDTSARLWVTAALAGIEEDSVVVSWWSMSTVLWYAQYVDGLRPDLTIIDDRTRLDLGYGEATDVIARFLGTRPVYVIRASDADLDLVRDRYVLMPLTNGPATNVYRVVREREPGG